MGQQITWLDAFVSPLHRRYHHRKDSAPTIPTIITHSTPTTITTTTAVRQARHNVEDLFAAVHRKEHEMKQVNKQHASTTDPVRMAMSYAQESATPMRLAKALRRVHDDPGNPAHPDYQQADQATTERAQKLKDIGMAELGMRRPSLVVDIKRQSKLTHPHGGPYCKFDDAGQVAAAMVRLGADAVFINPDFPAYGGDWSEVRSAVRAVRQVSDKAAVVVKDIVVDEIQLGLAKEAGADGIVLMSSVLGPALETFVNLATTIGLETIVECHTKNEVEYALEKVLATNILVNNYDRIRQELHPDQAIRLAGLFPGSGGPMICLATGGLADLNDMKRHLQAGYDGLVIGQAIMAQPDRAPSMIRTLRDRSFLPAEFAAWGLDDEGKYEFDVDGNLRSAPPSPKTDLPKAEDPSSFE